jgi:hypothetical protein
MNKTAPKINKDKYGVPAQPDQWAKLDEAKRKEAQAQRVRDSKESLQERQDGDWKNK